MHQQPGRPLRPIPAGLDEADLDVHSRTDAHTMPDSSVGANHRVRPRVRRRRTLNRYDCFQSAREGRRRRERAGNSGPPLRRLRQDVPTVCNAGTILDDETGIRIRAGGGLMFASHRPTRTSRVVAEPGPSPHHPPLKRWATPQPSLRDCPTSP